MEPISEKSKIYVGKLPEEASGDTLMEHFARYGRVLEAKVVRGERATGNRKDFGFVWFADEDSATAAIGDVEEHVIMGTEVCCASSSVEVKESFRREPVQPGNPPSSNRIGGAKKIFVGGLPHNLTEEEFRTYFGNAGETTDMAIIVDPDTGIGRGFGFVTYASEDSARRVLEHSYYLIQGKILEVKVAIPRAESNPPSRRNSPGTDAATRNGFHGNYVPPPPPPLPQPQPYYSTNGFFHSPYGWTNGFLGYNGLATYSSYGYWEPRMFNGGVPEIRPVASREVIVRNPEDGTRIHLRPPRSNAPTTSAVNLPQARTPAPAHPPSPHQP